MSFDVLLLSRLQFAFTVSFHILFPAFTIGLASFLAVLEGLWLFTRRDVFQRLYLFWVKVFAISFGLGVVSGVVMSYEFGTNWSRFSETAMPVIGPLFAYEVLTAFFLEASFLGIMLFGWKRVGEKLHFVATCVVAIGTLISAFWILSANSWMQTPAGFKATAKGLEAIDYWQVVFNPSFPIRFVHMVIAAYLTTALAVGAACAYQYVRRRAREGAKVGLRMGVLMLAVVAPLQLLAGHESGLVARQHQPAKIAAMEGWWETKPVQGTSLVGLPDQRARKNHLEIVVPGTSPYLFDAKKGENLRGLDSFKPEDIPPVFPVYWAFRIMVGIGLLMIALGLSGAVLWLRRKLDDARLFHLALTAAGPLGFVAILAGWVTTEVGRQPYVIYGVLRTADAVSPIGAGQVSASLLAFLLAYAAVFTAGAIYTLRLIANGPESDAPPTPHDRPPGSPLGAAPREGAAS